MGLKALLASTLVCLGLLSLIDRLVPATNWMSAARAFLFVLCMPWIFGLIILPRGAGWKLAKAILGSTVRRDSIRSTARSLGAATVWTGAVAVFAQYFAWLRQVAVATGNVGAPDVGEVLPVLAFPLLVGFVFRWLLYESIARDG